MKYKFGDLVYYKPAPDCGIPFYMEVIDFCEKKNKYVCMDYSLYAPFAEPSYIYLCSEEDLGYLSEVDNVDDYLFDGKPPLTKKLSKLDYYYFKIYEPMGEDTEILVRDAVRHKYPYDY